MYPVVFQQDVVTLSAFFKIPIFFFLSAKAAAAIVSASATNMGSPSPGIGGNQDFKDFPSYPGGSGQGGSSFQHF